VLVAVYLNNMEETIKDINALTKEDLIRILGNLYNSGVQKDMLISLGFKEKEARSIDDIMDSCEIICENKYGWHISNGN